jgi:hypothetical protein
MKNSELIAKLQTLPPDMHVCVFDWKLNAFVDEDSGTGIYPDIEFEVMNAPGEGGEPVKDEWDEEIKPWIALLVNADESLFYDASGPEEPWPRKPTRKKLPPFLK